MQTLSSLAIPATRHDGWTPARQWGFLQALGDLGSVKLAAASVGLTAQSAYRLRRHPAADDFRVAWDASLDDALRRVTEMGIERVLYGETEIYERGDTRITRQRPCAPQVMINMLAHAARIAEATARTAEAKAEVARVAAATAAATQRRWTTGGDRPQPPQPPPLEPLSLETAGLARLHMLMAAFPDRCGWEGPANLGNDTAVPRLPMPAVTLDPVRTVLRAAAQGGRVRDLAALAARAAAKAAAKAAADVEAAAKAERQDNADATCLPRDFSWQNDTQYHPPYRSPNHSPNHSNVNEPRNLRQEPKIRLT